MSSGAANEDERIYSGVERPKIAGFAGRKRGRSLEDCFSFVNGKFKDLMVFL